MKTKLMWNGLYYSGESALETFWTSNPNRALAFDIEGKPFQTSVDDWIQECFGPEIASNREERTWRFLEEALELAQANGCSVEDAHKLVDYVFGRPVGEIEQEVGGVMVTLSALCSASDIEMMDAGRAEVKRVWSKMDVIRAKHAAKTIRTPLPGEAA